ncbi:MAG: 16S rRNA (cytidine(1402)-2'-O)-methyltransferase, partial [bacterium]|nr:16S rRNA (cytidine(1402)-2'-O)-methyltransferase [bacterium]
MNNVAPSGRLLVVSIPIGNDDDITLRAIKALGASDVVVCEEEREGRRLLRLLDLQKPLQELNEHSDSSDVQSILDLLSSGSVVALVSDAGTPLLADPGQVLIRRCLAHDIGIEVVPGASSILTAVVRSGFDCGAFLFAGFVRRVEEERLEDFRKLASEPRTIILLEAPYRLRQLLSSAAAIMPERRAYVGCNLTMPSETHHYGTIAELSAKFTEKTFKGEFVVCIQGTTAAHQPMIDDMQTNDSGRGRGGKRRGGPGGQHPPQGRPPRGDSPKPWPAPKANYDDEQPRDNAGVNGYAPTPRPYDPNREQRPSRPQRQGAPRREGQGGPRRDGPDGPRRDGPDGPR